MIYDSGMPNHRPSLRRLDLIQLSYLRAVASAGSVTAAAEVEHVTPQTVSGQIRVLEERLGGALLRRAGRGVELTELGRMVLRYADDILGRADDLLRAIEDPELRRPTHFRVGIGHVVPKLVACGFLRPVLALREPPRLSVRDGTEEDLFAELRLRRLDAVIAAGYLPTQEGLVARELAVSRIGVFGTSELATNYRRGFPQSLDAAPMLMPGPGSPTRRFLEAWLAGNGIVPRVVGEFDDVGHREAFAAAGAGLFFAPEIIAPELERQHGVVEIGCIADIWARYFLVTVARSFIPPGEAAIAAEWPR